MQHNFDHDPWRRGIYRANAQRLSISLAPLVAQRSLLFRVKADLADAGKGVESYSDLEDKEESPALYSITPSASEQVELPKATGLASVPSAAELYRIGKPAVTPLSIPSALSTSSVYSQDSWNPNSSLVTPVKVNPRRHAIALSPGVRLDDLRSPLVSGHLEFSDGMYHKRTLRAAPTFQIPSSARLKMKISTSTRGKTEGNENDEIPDPVLVGSIQLVDEPEPVFGIRLQVQNLEEPLVNNPSEEQETDTVAALTKDGANNVTSSNEQSTGGQHRSTTPTKLGGPTSRKVLKPSGFRKMISRLSRYSSNNRKEDIALPLPWNRADPFSSLQLPELRLSPIKLAFDIPDLSPSNSEKNLNQEQNIEPMCHPPPSTLAVSTPSSQPMSVASFSVIQTNDIATRHHGRPRTPTRMPGAPTRRVRRRTNSSPASPRVNARNQWWNPEDMPPLPPIPPFFCVPKLKGIQPVELPEAMRVTISSKSDAPINEPRPRPPRAMRPPGHNLTPHLLVEDHPLYSPLQTKADRWDEIIATTPLSVSTRSRGKSVSSSSGVVSVDSRPTTVLPPWSTWR